MLRELLAGIAAPLNVLVGPGAPSVPQLPAIGIRRVSAGSSIAQAAFGLARRAAVELLSDGTHSSLERDLDYSELNRLVAPR